MSRTAIREQTFRLIYSIEIQKQKNLSEAIKLYIEANNITDKNIKNKLLTELGISKVRLSKYLQFMKLSIKRYHLKWLLMKQ